MIRTSSDDLTKLKGVGKATADKLTAAGIGTFGQLAVATDEQLITASVGGKPADWTAWRREAQTFLSGVPIDLTTATADEVAAQVTRIENARAAIHDFATGVVTAHASRAAMTGDVSPELLAFADTTLADANQMLQLAVAEARGLLGVPEGEELPAALLEELAPLHELTPIDTIAKPGDEPATPRVSDQASEIPAGSHNGDAGQSGAAAPALHLPVAGLDGGTTADMDSAPKPDTVASASGTNTTPTEAMDGGTGNAAGPADTRSEDGRVKLGSFERPDFNAIIDEEIADVLDLVDQAVAEGRTQDAAEHLARVRSEASQMREAAGRIDAAMAARQTKLLRSVTCWPLSPVHYDGELRPIGQPVDMDPTTFNELLATKVVSDTPPEEDIIEGDSVAAGPV